MSTAAVASTIVVVTTASATDRAPATAPATATRGRATVNGPRMTAEARYFSFQSSTA